MPHDKKGRLIEVGDVIKAKPYNYANAECVGRVVKMREGQQCSGDAAFFMPQPYENHDLLPRIDAFGADEAELILKADGSEPVDAPVPESAAAVPVVAEEVVAPAIEDKAATEAPVEGNDQPPTAAPQHPGRIVV